MKLLLTLFRKGSAKCFLFILFLFFARITNAQSLRFTDTSFVNLGNPASLKLTDFTIEAWIKIEGHGSTTETGTGGQADVVPIITKGRAETELTAKDINYFIGFRRSDMKLIADFEDNATSANHSVVSNAVLVNCVWTHLAVSYNTSTDTWKIYINGVLDKTESAGGNFTPQSLSDVNACIGSSLNTGGTIRPGFFNGRIDEVRIWNIVRTDAEITANYNSEIMIASGLAARYGLNENTGIVANNSIAGANGDLTNAPLWVAGFNQTETVTKSSVSLNGKHDYISFGKGDGTAGNPTLNVTVFTLEAWIKIEGAGVTASSGSGGVVAIPIIAKGRGEGDAPANLNMNYFFGIDAANKLVADFEESGGPNHPVTGTATVATGVWVHVAASYGSGTWNLYINGVLDKTESESGAIPVSNSIQHASIGSALNSTGVTEGFFNGKIDEVRIWNIMRTGSEVSTNYLNEITSGAGLLGRWGLNENCNNTAFNSIAGGATGSLTSTNTTTHPTNGGPYWYPFNFNLSPNLPANPIPANGVGSSSINPQLCATASDPNGGNLRVRFYGHPKIVNAGNKFTIIWVPDTQFYTSGMNGGSNEIFKSQTNWIVANKTPLNIKYVGQLGDCVQSGDNGGNDIEWKRADTSIKIIEDPVTTNLTHGIPYGISVGNHDQGPTGNGDPNGTTNFYNQYFGETRFTGRPYYGGHYGVNNDNHFQLFSASGIDFISISLEFDPSAIPNAAVLNWADNLLKTYPTRKGIIYGHYFLNANGSFGTQGANVYNALKNNPNLILMVCGHVTEEARRTDVFNGNTVHTVLSDYQARTNGGNGWLRIFEFDPGANTISVKTYSPWLNQYETDASSQFILNTDLSTPANFTLIGELTSVASGSQACVSWNNIQFGTEYEWYAEVFDGESTVTGPVWSFTTPVGTTLPLSLLHLSATHENEKVKILWKTKNELNVSAFEIERSANGTSFHKTGTVAARGSLSGEETYTSYDHQPLKGRSFYRLKQLDNDGRFKYSPVAIVYINEKKSFDIFPNPAKQNTINLVFSSTVKEKLNIKIYDLSGRLHINKEWIIPHQQCLIHHALAPGSYTISVQGKDWNETKQLIVE